MRGSPDNGKNSGFGIRKFKYVLKLGFTVS